MPYTTPDKKSVVGRASEISTATLRAYRDSFEESVATYTKKLESAYEADASLAHAEADPGKRALALKEMGHDIQKLTTDLERARVSLRSAQEKLQVAGDASDTERIAALETRVDGLLAAHKPTLAMRGSEMRGAVVRALAAPPSLENASPQSTDTSAPLRKAA